MPLQPFFDVRMPGGQTYQLRIVQNGQADRFPDVLFRVLLARIQIQMTHGATCDNAVRVGLLRLEKNFAYQLFEDIHFCEHQARAAAIRFV
jgi:hypothetical protein